MKKEYMKPTMNVVKIRQAQMICTSQVERAANNAGLNENIGSGNGDARSRSFDGFDDFDDWDE